MGKNLVTKAEYKAYAGINSTTQDAEIDSLIPKVSELVKSYCRRTFVDYVDDMKIETFKGGHKELLLSEFPVTQVVSVQVSNDYGQTYTKLTKFTDWIPDGDTVVSLDPAGLGFKELINGYKVSYFAGYDPLPEDLKLATLDIITYYLKNSSAVHSTRSIQPNTTQIEYVTGSQFPSHIRRVLDMYKANYL
jgi:hypothetical protein